MKLSRLFLALAVLCVPLTAHAQLVQYRAADNINNTSVSAATPLPVTAAGSTPGGSVVGLCVNSNGVLCSVKAGTANRTITKTSLTADTSTTVCPTATDPVSVEIQVQSGDIGLGFQGQALTAKVLGTTTTDPDLVMQTAGSLYTFPVAPSNAITARGAAQVVSCIQTLRQ